MKPYVLLTKPGIVLGNLLAAVGGFMLAYSALGSNFPWQRLIYFFLSTAFIIASAGIINNYLDRNIDARMERTKRRATVTGVIPISKALALSVLLAVLGFSLLYFKTTTAAFVAGIAGFVCYLVPYGLAKRHGPYGTLVGSLPGAIPPLAGYLTVSAKLDWVAVWLFLAMVFWQMPHFYAIAVRRLKDYTAANVPVLPVVKGVRRSKYSSVGYILLFYAAALQLYLLDAINIIYALALFVVTLWWLAVGYSGLIRQQDNTIWGKKFMKVSVKVLLVWSFLLALSPALKPTNNAKLLNNRTSPTVEKLSF